MGCVRRWNCRNYSRKYGSFLWQKIDGKKSIYEIGKELQAVHEGAATQLYERLSQYFAILERNKYIVFEE